LFSLFSSFALSLAPFFSSCSSSYHSFFASNKGRVFACSLSILEVFVGHQEDIPCNLRAVLLNLSLGGEAVVGGY
jgi:hypothetical protein